MATAPMQPTTAAPPATPAPTTAPPVAAPKPYQEKLARQRANRQAKRQAKYARQSGGSPSVGMNQQFSQALYGDTSIQNDAKNAIQGVHEKFSKGQATRQELAQAVFNSGLPHDLKLKLMQMYGGGAAQPAGADPVVGSGAPADPKIMNEAIRSPSRRFIATI